MFEVTVRLSDEEFAAIQSYADRHRTPIHGLVKEYLAYLIEGGEPVSPTSEDPGADALAEATERGGAFDWLASEPDIYSLADGEPV